MNLKGATSSTVDCPDCSLPSCIANSKEKSNLMDIDKKLEIKNCSLDKKGTFTVIKSIRA